MFDKCATHDALKCFSLWLMMFVVDYHSELNIRHTNRTLIILHQADRIKMLEHHVHGREKWIEKKNKNIIKHCSIAMRTLLCALRTHLVFFLSPSRHTVRRYLSPHFCSPFPSIISVLKSFILLFCFFLLLTNCCHRSVSHNLCAQINFICNSSQQPSACLPTNS